VSGGGMPKAAVSKFDFGGVPVVSTVSWLSPIRRRALTIVGDAAALVFDDRLDKRLVFHAKEGADPIYPPYSAELPLTRELAKFVEAIRSGTNDPGHVELGLSIARSISAAQRSIALGQSVAI